MDLRPSGRHRPPDIRVVDSLTGCIEELPADGTRIVCHPGSGADLDLRGHETKGVCVLIGPEGGFSEADLAVIDAAGFSRIGLGPRVLRADTAAIAACSVVQLLWGDGVAG